MNNNDDESNVNHNKYIVNVSYSDIAFQCCRRDCFTVLRTNNMIRLVNTKDKETMIHEEKRKGVGVGDPQRRNKHLRSDRSARETTFKKNILTIPLQSCSLLYYNTHVHAHRLTKKAVGEVMRIITSTLLMTGWTNYLKNTLNSLKPQQAS